MSNRINHAMILFYSFCVSMAFSQVTFTRVTTLSTYLTSDETVRLEPVNLGDINEDGYLDLGVNNYRTFTQPGTLYAYSGGSHFNTWPRFSINSEIAFPSLGSFDFDGDGYFDLAIAGVIHYDSNNLTWFPQSVNLYTGDGTGFHTTPAVAFQPTYYEWWNAWMRPSYTLAAGDINGDGYDDLLIGAPFDVFDGSGRVYLHLGREYIEDSLDTIPDWTLIGTEGSMTGYSLDVADMNGDGYCDFIIGSPLGPDEIGGALHVFAGGDQITAFPTTIIQADVPPPGLSSIGFEIKLLPQFGDGKSLVLSNEIITAPYESGFPLGVVLDSTLNVVEQFIIPDPFENEYGSITGGFCIGHFDEVNALDVLIVGNHYSFETETHTGALYLYLNPVEPSDFLIPDTVLGPIQGIIPHRYTYGRTIESIDLNNDSYDEVVIRTKDTSDNKFIEIYTFNELLLDLEGEYDGISRPADFRLLPNFPNPFNAATSVQFNLPVDGFIELQVYDMAGNQVKTLVSGEKAAGAHVVTWLGDNDRGQMTASGVYHLVLTATEAETGKQHRLLQKAILLK